MRKLVCLAALMSCILPAVGAAQDMSNLSDEAEVRFGSFRTRTTFGQMGVSFAKQCRPEPTSQIYLVQRKIYATDPAACVTILVNNSRPSGADATPTWLNIQVTRYYESYDNVALTVARSGSFSRAGRTLDELPREGVTVPRAQLEEFDSVHAASTPEQAVGLADTLLGLLWHGFPAGNDAANTWTNREQLQSSKTYQTQIKLTSRALNTRLIRYTPGDTSQPLTIGEINRNGARVMVVKVFSPYSVDVGGTFALVFETDPSKIETLVTARTAETSCTFFCLLARWF
jgi:hypothetical protein